jgi:hypothetical protein
VDATPAEPSPFDEPAPAEPTPAEPTPAEPSPFDEPTPAEPTPAEPSLFDEPAPAADPVPAVEPEPAAEQPTPAEPAAGDDPFDLFNDKPADAPKADASTNDPFDLFNDKPAAPAESGTDIFGTDAPADDQPADDAGDTPAESDPFDDLLNPTSNRQEEEEKKPSSIFDELFGAANQISDLYAQAAQDVVANSADQALTAVADPAPAIALRTWIDNSGTFSTEGKLILVTDQFVRLLKPNGRTCTVPLDRLSPSDADYVSRVADTLDNHEVKLITTVR